jgi:hypothetical protein
MQSLRNFYVSSVEVQLVDKLDEQRGFCVQIRGHKERAKVHGGLQAHTRYSYQGQLSVDQAFEEQLISRGKFYLPVFDVCMEVCGSVAGSRLNLKACNDTEERRFEFTANDKIKLISNEGLCLAIDASSSKQGGGGTPLYLLRSMSVTNCETSGTRYMTWRMVAMLSN